MDYVMGLLVMDVCIMLLLINYDALKDKLVWSYWGPKRETEARFTILWHRSKLEHVI